MKNTGILIAIALAIGTIGGFIAGKNDGDDADLSDLPDPTAVSDLPDPSGGLSEPGRGGTRASRPNDHERASQNRKFMDRLRKESANLSSLPKRERREALLEMIALWAREDPASAMRYFSENRGEMGEAIDHDPMFIFDAITHEWATVDPQGALTWIFDNEDDYLTKFEAMNSIVSNTAGKDIAAAIALCETLGSSPRHEKLRNAALSIVAKKYGQMDFAAARTWIATLEESQQKNALSAAISGLATKSPPQAVREIAALPHDPSGSADSLKNSLVASVVGRAARDNPMLAASLIEIPTHPAAKDRAAGEVMSEWIKQDSAAALGYVQSLPPGTAYDRTMVAFVQNNPTGNPAEMLRLAETIGYDDTRNATVLKAATRWMQTDPAAARSYIEQAETISDSTRQQILGQGGED